jgi:glutamine synthetase
MTDSYEQAHAYHETVLPAMEELREPCDFLEQHLDERDWPLPSYFDMMFRLEDKEAAPAGAAVLL